MITTNVERLEGELGEVLNEFTSEQLDVAVNFKPNGKTFLYTVTCGGESENFSYQVEFNNEIEKKRVTKRYAKLSLYEFLSKKNTN